MQHCQSASLKTCVCVGKAMVALKKWNKTQTNICQIVVVVVVCCAEVTMLVSHFSVPIDAANANRKEALEGF